MKKSGQQPELAKNAVSFSHVLAQGLISNGPLASTVAALTAAASYAMGALPLAYLLGGLMVFLWLNTPWQFSKRLASPAGMQYFVTKGMNGVSGYLAGIAYAVYYIALPAANAVLFGVMISSILQQLGIVNPPNWLWVPLMVLFVIPPLVLTYLGIRSSLTYGAVTAVFEMIVLVAVSLYIIIRLGGHNTLAVYNPHLASGGISGFAVGSLVASFGMSGSTAAVYLGGEAKAPQKTIKRSLFLGGGMIVVMFILVSYAMTVGWGYTKMSGFASSNIPGLLVIHHFLGTIPELITAAIVVNSLIGINVASNIVVSRLFLSFSKSELLPDGVGRIHPVHKTPYVAVITTTALILMLGLAGGLIWGAGTGFVVLILIATMAEFMGHILGDIALPLYYWKEKMLQFVIHLLIPVASLVLILFGVFYTFFPVSFPLIYAPVFVLLIMAIGGIQYAKVFIWSKRQHIADEAIQKFSEEAVEVI